VAGDWIKMRCDLRSDPAVFKLAEITGLDRFAVVGRLAEFWSWIDKHAVDGRVDGGTSTAIDDVVAHVGFADALMSVRWLSVDADGVYIPKHEQHNGDSAKDRNLKSERQARWRAKKAAESASKHVDGHVDATPSTREEKRREEKNTPVVPKGTVDVPDWIPAKPWADFVAMRRAKGNKVPFTVAAAKGIIAKLDGFRASGIDVGAVLSESVINGWSGVFEPKGSLSVVRRQESFV
jgi:hypothetical protein